IRTHRPLHSSPTRRSSDLQIAPATVVVQFADVEAIPNDPKLRLDMNLAGGNGELVVFSNGTRRDGTWSKDSPRNSTVWLDTAGRSEEHTSELQSPYDLVCR